MTRAAPVPDAVALFPAKAAVRGVRGARAAAGTLPTQAFVGLASQLSPAVVSITVNHQGDDEGGRRRGREQGSGVIVNAQGYVLTNNHVVEQAADIHVRLQDERDFTARLVGRDERTDIALLKIDAGDRPLPWAPLGNSDRVQIGEWVMAIGSPFGLSHTVTVGIVSAKGRRDVQPGAQPGFFDFLQTDAPINPGNSGGPLLNLSGEVIGINSAMNAAGSGIGFAIPSNLARTVAEQLHRHGYVLRSWLGVYPQPLTEALRKSFGVPDRRGALVAEVYVRSPAAQAGLRAGDVITDFAGRKLERADDLMWLLGTLQPAGSDASQPPPPVTVRYIRAGAAQQVDVRLPAPPAPERGGDANSPRKPSSLGLAVTEMTPTLIEKSGYDGERGLVVLTVEAGSPAMEGGAERGDIVLQVNDQPVRSLADYLATVGRVPSGGLVRLLVRRLEVQGERGPRGGGGASAGEDAKRHWHNLWIAFSRR